VREGMTPSVMRRRYPGWADLGTWPPGSPEAVRAGCVCPVVDNAHGYGRGTREGVRWAIIARCQYHAAILERVR
jgi:hypothetical protein